MGAYKKLNKQDAYITTYTARKSWAVSGTPGSAYNQFNTTYGINWYSAGFEYYNSLQQLYYPTKDSSGVIPTHSFDYYDQTTLFYSSSRSLITGSFILSMPKTTYGTHIQPGSFSLAIPQNAVVDQLGTKADFVLAGYVKEVATIEIKDPSLGVSSIKGDVVLMQPRDPIIIDPPKLTPALYTYLDDSEGNIYVSGSSPRQYVGDIIYTHGMAVVTDLAHVGVITSVVGNRRLRGQALLSWQSNQPIFTHNYHCKLRESEFNFTYNPSALTSSLKTTYDNNGDLYATSSKSSTGYLNNNVTGSSFQPYITTVGLYNDANELIAVGKMAQPIPKSANTEMTFIVKIDI